MPIKYNLTKYDIISSQIKKITAKKGSNGDGADPEDKKTMLKAVLIASFSSGHSWQTYKAATSSTPMAFNKPEIKKEYVDSVTSKWKTITPFDIDEVSKSQISDNAFSEWLFFNVGKEDHESYKEAWDDLKMDFNDSCDDVEKN